jgi:UDP-N-acetylglucosamine 3-dehydrogenase
MPGERLRAGVVGLGAIGRHHARVWAEVDGVELVAVADLDEDRRTTVSRRYKIHCYPDHESLLDEEQLDLLSVAVPTGMHSEVTTRALERGVHVLVEKPIAATVEEAVAMRKLAASLGRVLAVGHIERFNPAVVELRRRIQKNELGRVFEIQARRLSPMPDYVLDAGVVMDLATHELDVMRYVNGSGVERVYAEMGRNLRDDHEDHLSGLLRFENGVLGVLDVNWLTPTKVRELRVTGERGMFVVDYIAQDLYFYENSEAPLDWDAMALFKGVQEGNMTKIQVRRVEPLRAELEAFAANAASGERLVASGEDGLHALVLAQLLLRSASEGAVVNVRNALEELDWAKHLV